MGKTTRSRKEDVELCPTNKAENAQKSLKTKQETLQIFAHTNLIYIFLFWGFFALFSNNMILCVKKKRKLRKKQMSFSVDFNMMFIIFAPSCQFDMKVTFFCTKIMSGNSYKSQSGQKPPLAARMRVDSPCRPSFVAERSGCLNWLTSSLQIRMMLPRAEACWSLSECSHCSF